MNSLNYEALVKSTPKPSPEESPSPTRAPVVRRKNVGDLPTAKESPSPPIAVSSTPWKSFNLSYNSQSFFYPFEDYVLDFQLDLRKELGVTLPLDLQVSNQIGQVILQRCDAGYSFEKTTADPNSFSVVLSRYRFVKLTAIILYSVAFLFLFYIARREEASKVLANSLGYLAALWGVRGIIVGPANLFPTIIDFLTLALYMAVTAIVVHRWFFTWSKVKTHEDEE